MIPCAPQRFGIVPASGDPAIEVFVRHRREFFEQSGAVAIQFYLDLCAIHVFSIGKACSKNPNASRVNVVGCGVSVNY